MIKTRCKVTTTDSFFGNFLYEQVVPRGHFLVKLKEVIDWQRFTIIPLSFSKCFSSPFYLAFQKGKQRKWSTETCR